MAYNRAVLPTLINMINAFHKIEELYEELPELVGKPTAVQLEQLSNAVKAVIVSHKTYLETL